MKIPQRLKIYLLILGYIWGACTQSALMAFYFLEEGAVLIPLLNVLVPILIMVILYKKYRVILQEWGLV